MSWGALPWWFYEVGYERLEAQMLGAFAEELNAGWTRSVPDRIVKMNIKDRADDEIVLYSLGVDWRI
jgi:hypothetical protein